MNVEDIAHSLRDELKKSTADYVEARFEETESSYLTYRGRELEATGRSSGRGGCVRALIKGGWGFTSFNRFDNLVSRLRLAEEQARAAGSTRSQLAEITPVVDRVPSGIARDPVEIPLAEKKSLLDEYNEVIWGIPRIQTSTIAYADSRFYCLSEDDGEVVLIEPSTEGWKEHGRFKLDPQTDQRKP
ncbi:MAG: hypothetical protein N2506_05000, partial [Dehalococcoidales bacterium]|nr:hypothetical protein [Dehalococcoidales bacterium]